MDTGSKPPSPQELWEALASNDLLKVSKSLNGIKALDSLRDTFAAAALQGDWANPGKSPLNHHATPSTLEERATLYYKMADAMMSARGSVK